MAWWNRLPEIARDALGAVPLVLLFAVAQQGFGEGRSTLRGIGVVVAILVAMTLRRRRPFASYVIALAPVALAQTGLELLAVISYSLMVYEERARPALIMPLSAIAAVVGYLQYWPAFVLVDVAPDLATIAVVAVLPVVLGRAVRQYRVTTAELAARNAELVRLREQEAEHAVQTERLRIARELHDVVAHHVSAMTVRARAGHHVAAKDPGAAVDALAYIAESGTATLTSMRTFVRTLREGSVDEVARVDGLAPQPGIEAIPALLESLRRTGLVVHEDLAPAPAGITPALGLNVYRIVQEALTNVIRHAAAERAWVSLRFDDGQVHVQVDDNGHGPPADASRSGHGLVGVRERAALHGGTAELGPSPRGGCRLQASLSLSRPDPTRADAGERRAVSP